MLTFIYCLFAGVVKKDFQRGTFEDEEAAERRLRRVGFLIRVEIDLEFVN